MVSIVDNLADQKTIDNLQSLMLNPDAPMKNTSFPWYYQPVIDFADEEDKFQFTHMFYIEQTPTSEFVENLNPILEIIRPISIHRIKANLLTKTPNIIENSFHVDMNDLSEEKLKQWTTSIFYVNTNNGYTIFEDGTKVESVANRLVTFPGNMKHTGTSCTDEKIRVVINFNYFSSK